MDKKNLKYYLLFSLCLVSLLTSFNFKETTHQFAKNLKDVSEIIPTLSNVHYGQDPMQVLDFWQYRSEKPTPLVIYIHSGGWAGGDKNSIQTGGPDSWAGFKNPAGKNINMKNELLTELINAGISVIAINYRFVTAAQKAGIKPPVKWPMEDAKRTLQYIRCMAKKWNIDKERIGLMGTSAGACSSMWLAMHDDMSDLKSRDTLERESTRVFCVAVLDGQTTLDPKQLFEWFKSPVYGAHAFGFVINQGNKVVSDMNSFIAARDNILPWIKEYSPIEWASPDDPPICLAFSEAPQPFNEPQLNSVHGASFGINLKKKFDQMGVECHVIYQQSADSSYSKQVGFMIEKLK